MIADTFFIDTSPPPFTDFTLTLVRGRIADVTREHTPFFCLVKTIFSEEFSQKNNWTEK